MTRREWLAAAAAAGLTPSAALAQVAQPDLRAAARDAYVFGLPMLEFARVRQRTLGAGLPPNRFNHARQLSGPEARTVTTPNNDTLYSNAFLDLAGGPITLTLPATGERYQSVALMDAWTNNVAVLGTRTTGPGGATVVVVGPNTPLPEGAQGVVRSPTRWIWALGRTLVDGPADLPGAHAAQDGLKLSGGAPGPKPAAITVARDGDPLAVLSAISALVREDPPLAEDWRMRAAAAPALRDYSTVRMTAEGVAALNAGLADARQALRGGGLGGGGEGGWSYPRANLGAFRQDYGYRAAVAMNGLAALPREEAMYMRPAVGPGELTGDWRLRLPAGGIPLDGFWSLTMYEVDPAGQLWLVDNPLKRYAIGDRTPGLKVAADKSVELRLGPTDPGPALRSNWLPAPRSGKFTVVLRTYLPRPALLDGRWKLPPLERV